MSGVRTFSCRMDFCMIFSVACLELRKVEAESSMNCHFLLPKKPFMIKVVLFRCCGSRWILGDRRSPSLSSCLSVEETSPLFFGEKCRTLYVQIIQYAFLTAGTKSGAHHLWVISLSLSQWLQTQDLSAVGFDSMHAPYRWKYELDFLTNLR